MAGDFEGEGMDEPEFEDESNESPEK